MPENTHDIHLTPEQRALHEIQQGVKAMQGVFAGDNTITLKGADGKTPQVGVDYLTEEELSAIKMQVGQLVIDYVMPRIRQPMDGKTPIPGIDFPTGEQVASFIESAIEKVKKQKIAKSQLPSEITDLLKGKEIEWKDIKNRPKLNQQQMVAAGGRVIRIQNEGTTVSDHVTVLNFIGAGVDATYNGSGVVAITIAGSSGNFAHNETPTGTQNGVNDTFTLANTPSPAASLQLYMNGQLLAAAGEDYTLTTATIVYIPAKIPASTDVIRAFYQY